ncbi:MAG: DUF6515 family protein [Ferruginibacter sp.]
MTQDHPIYLPTKMYRYFSLAFIAALCCLQTTAQHKSFERRENRPQRGFSPDNRQQPIQNSAPRQQNPVAGNSSNSRWRHDANRPQPSTLTPPPRQQNQVAGNQSSSRWRHDANRPQPTQIQGQPQANNNGSSLRPNGSNNNSRFGNSRNYPRASRYDNYRNGPGYRRPVYNARNPGWRYSYLPRRHAIITSFSYPYQTIYYGGYGYRYCDGVYYRPYNNAFQVVTPPFGIFINILPFGYRRVVVHENPYYYYNGTYYDEYESSYRVVAPPVGAIVESIPEGYETIVIDGETYYKVDDVQYKPVVQDNGEIWYEVIKVS